MSGQHKESSTSRWTRRGFLGIPIVLWRVFAVTAVLAVAGWYVLLGTTGQLSTSGDNIDVVFDTSAAPVVVGPCTASITDAETFDLNGTDLMPGDMCAITFNVINTGSVDAYYQGFGANWVEGFDIGIGSNWDCQTPDWDGDPQNCDDWANEYCGLVIPSDGTPTQIGLMIDVNEGTTPGLTMPFDVNQDGFQFGINLPNPEHCN